MAGGWLGWGGSYIGRSTTCMRSMYGYLMRTVLTGLFDS